MKSTTPKIKEILEKEPDEEIVLERAIAEMLQKREMIDNLICIAQMMKDSGVSFNSMRHCFSDVKFKNSDDVLSLMAATARSFDFWSNEEYFEEICMTEEDENEILDALRNILLLRERKKLFMDQKVLEQVAVMYKVISNTFSDSLIFFRGILIEYLSGSEMARWLDKEWGDEAAKYIQDAVEYFCRIHTDNNIDQVWIKAFDKLEYLKKNGYAPGSDEVQQEVLKIYECIRKTRWLTELGKQEALRKIAKTVECKAFRDTIDQMSSEGTAEFCSEAIMYFYEKNLKSDLNAAKGEW